MHEEITFNVECRPEIRGFLARIDDPRGGGITTQGNSLGDPQAMIIDAVGGYFERGEAPMRIKVHFCPDSVLKVA